MYSRKIAKQIMRQVARCQRNGFAGTIIAPGGTASQQADMTRALSAGLMHPQFQAMRAFSAEGAGKVEKMEFKAETKKLLNIVAKSLYTDKEVFIRELISNASDACEKLRFLQNSGKAPENLYNPEQKLKIHLAVNESGRQFTIQDFGIGMTKEELVKNLGTIARSGSLEFLEQSTGNAADQSNTIIGQFGVGFYSAFVVADKIEVFTRSADADQVAYKWESDGMGEFSISESPDFTERGTKIVLHLKEECAEFSRIPTMKSCAKKFSSFVDFPLFIEEDGVSKELNKQEPLWLKTSPTAEEHTDFYRFLSGTSYGDPYYTLNFSSDVPLTIKSLFYVPEDAPSRFFAKDPEIGVALHCRRVLVKKQAEGIIPRWLHWLKGVVDCEDMPLNISRESMQDTQLMNKLSLAVVRRFLRFLDQQSKKDPEKYLKFYKNYSYYLKAGLVEDRENGNRHKDELIKLLRFACSKDGEMLSLQEYVDKHMIDNENGKQKNIYYYCVPNRETAMNSPYMEQWKARGRSVLFMHDDIDEFVISSVLDGYKEYQLVAIDAQDKDFELHLDAPADEKPVDDKIPELSVAQQDELKTWMKTQLGNKVMDVKFTDRLVSSPAVITSVLTPHMRRMMKQMMQAQGTQNSAADNVPMTLEVSPKHPVIKTIYSIKSQNPEVAQLSIDMLFDNACIAAGMLDEPRSVLPRLNKVLETMVYQSVGYDYASKSYKEDDGETSAEPTIKASDTETIKTSDTETIKTSDTETIKTSDSETPKDGGATMAATSGSTTKTDENQAFNPVRSTQEPVQNDSGRLKEVKM